MLIDQASIGTSSRSNPATYTGIMDDIRKAFAAANHTDAGLFSFNSKGACSNCQGLGVTYTDLGFLEGGNKGGTIIFEGTPRALLSAPHSLTSRYLR